MVKFLLAIAPVVFQYFFEEALEWWHNRNKPDQKEIAKQRVKKFTKALKNEDMDDVIDIFNSTLVRKRDRINDRASRHKEK